MIESPGSTEIKEDSPSDGEKVLASAEETHPKGITRRRFCQGALALTALFLSGCAPEWPESDTPPVPPAPNPPSPTEGEAAPPTETFLNPTLIHGVEVYGLGEKITSEGQITQLYGSLDEKFARENNIPGEIPITSESKFATRKMVLNPNERYLEVVVRQSAYDSFLNRQQETGVDFVEWIQIHVDTMNMCFQQSKPPVDMESVLRRIVVISDDMTRTFWDESAWDESQYSEHRTEALDCAYRLKFLDSKPLDTDDSWAVANDYRVNQIENDRQGYAYSIRHQNGKTVIGFPPGGETYDRTYEFPERDDSLKGKDGVWLDFALIHEWGHALMGFPHGDWYSSYDPKQRFPHFWFMGNDFLEPRIGSYLAYSVKSKIDARIREPIIRNECYYLGERPREVSVSVSMQGSECQHLGVKRVRLKDNDVTDNEEKRFPENDDYAVEGSQFTFPPDAFNDNSNCALLTIRISPDQAEKHLYFPFASLNMSSAVGLESARYAIELTGYDDPNKRTQVVEVVDESDIDGFLTERQSRNDIPYAKMKVDGTNAWFIWFLRD